MDDTIGEVTAAIAAREPVDVREKESIDRFLEAVPRLPRPFDEHADPTHITGSAIVVGRRGVVLHRHRKLGLWLQPGGHIDTGELPWDGALREAAEETGLDVIHPKAGPELVHVDVHPGPHEHTHLDLRYLLHAGDADPAPGPDESQDVRWFAWDDAIDTADPGLRGALIALRPRFEAEPSPQPR
ncbi:MAG: NUDIX hydrolase [Acidimicrobiales bacterium]